MLVGGERLLAAALPGEVSGDGRTRALGGLAQPVGVGQQLVDPLGEPEAVRKFVRSYVDAGATGFSMRFHHESRDHYIEQMGAFKELVATL